MSRSVAITWAVAVAVVLISVVAILAALGMEAEARASCRLRFGRGSQRSLTIGTAGADDESRGGQGRLAGGGRYVNRPTQN